MSVCGEYACPMPQDECCIHVKAAPSVNSDARTLLILCFCVLCFPDEIQSVMILVIAFVPYVNFVSVSMARYILAIALAQPPWSSS